MELHPAVVPDNKHISRAGLFLVSDAPAGVLNARGTDHIPSSQQACFVGQHVIGPVTGAADAGTVCVARCRS